MLNIGNYRKFATTREMLRTIGDGDLLRRGLDFKPIQKAEWCDKIEEYAKGIGWELSNFKYCIGSYYGTNSELHGCADFAPAGCSPLEGIYCWSLGWRLSNGGLHKPQLFLGGRFGLDHAAGGFCKLLCEFDKHSGLEIDDAFDEAFLQFPEHLEDLKEICLSWKEAELMPSELDRLLCELGRQKIVTWSRLSAVDSRCRESNRMNWWQLCQGIGEATAMNSPFKQIKKLSAAWNLLRAMAPRSVPA